jgi:hypothetical protein
MKPRECEKELLVIEAARSGAWDAELRKHIANCPACGDVALAAEALNAMRAVDVAEARIPDAGLMWWKAQLLSKRAAGERATKPISFVEHLSYACGIFAFVAVCVWQWAAIRGWLASLRPGRAGSAAHAAASPTSHLDIQALQNMVANWIQRATSLQGASLAIVLSVGVLLILVAFAAYLTRSEE